MPLFSEGWWFRVEGVGFRVWVGGRAWWLRKLRCCSGVARCKLLGFGSCVIFGFYGKFYARWIIPSSGIVVWSFANTGPRLFILAGWASGLGRVTLARRLPRTALKGFGFSGLWLGFRDQV